VRIVQVSAHFPPDFISGGTLVPQRIAAGLAARGHQISVFAGHLHESHPLRTWDEEIDGIPVRWISVGAFTDNRAGHNFANRGAETAFRAYLAEQRPDVVHLHSLQTMGGGLVTVAKESGAAVVVTMHDFWWICAQQFLVPPNRRPCSLVVAAGACPCAVSHGWLKARDARLARTLESADLILTPSRSAQRVLIANGIDPTKLRVDENGLPQLPPRVAVAVGGAESTDTVRLLFAGGADPMKGWPVLRDALAAVDDLPGWRLSAYGVPAAKCPADPRVEPRESYLPDQLAAVLAAHDVLILPSLMRESFSIVTREALAAGLAIICTDTLGPEEVVTDGHNGLVVPAGDDAALGDALRRVIADRALLARLRAFDPGAATHRSVDAQVDGLESSYSALVKRTSRPQPAPPSINRVLFVAGIEGAPLRYRARLPAEALDLHGVRCDVRHYRDSAISSLATRADAVVFYRVPATVLVMELIEHIRAQRPAVPVLFDVDDLIFDEGLRPLVRGISHLPHNEQELWWQGVRRYRTTLEAGDAFVGSTDALCRHATESTGLPAHRFPNGVGILLGQLSDAALREPRAPGPLRIGYFSGTNTHDLDWAAIEGAVVTVLNTVPEVELWLGGQLTTGPALAPYEARIRRIPFQPWWKLPTLLRDLDVNLAPLALGSPFNEAKSAIKWLEAALVATPTVASPTQPGVDGLLAADEDEWVAQLTQLLADPSLRRRIGERARREALLRYSPYTQGQRYLDILVDAKKHVANARREQQFTAYEVVDEPWGHAHLEAYEAPGMRALLAPSSADHSTVRRIAAAAMRYAKAVPAVARERGLRAVANDSARVARAIPARLARAVRHRWPNHFS
jgi:glycosyltransferase involved in cell wall biosynthesis